MYVDFSCCTIKVHCGTLLTISVGAYKAQFKVWVTKKHIETNATNCNYFVFMTVHMHGNKDLQNRRAIVV